MREGLKVYLTIASIICKRLHKKEWRFYLKEGLGIVPSFKKSILLHANAGGDVIGLHGFVTALRKSYPEHSILLSVDNFDAYHFAKQLMIFDYVFFRPFGLSWTNRRMLTKMNVKLFLPIKMLYFANLVEQCAYANIPLIIIRCHLRKEYFSYPEIQEITAKTRSVYHLVAGVIAETDTDSEVVKALGGNNVIVGGSLKYDLGYMKISEEEKAQLREQLHIAGEKLLVCIGARYGEEEMVLNIFSHLKGWKLFIAPRYPEKALESIKKTCNKLNISCSTKREYVREQVFIFDAFGEVYKYYAIADVVLLGATFILPGGGKNVLEPIYCLKPTVSGPYVHNMVEHMSYLRSFPWLKATTEQEAVKAINRAAKEAKKIEKILKKKKEEITTQRDGILKTYTDVITEMYKQK